MMSKTRSYKKVVEKRLYLHYLYELSNPGILALINEKDKRILVLGSKYPLNTLTRVITSLERGLSTNKQLRKDKRRLQIRILESTPAVIISKLKWIDYYKNLGYTLYNKEVLPKYRVDSRINMETRRIEVCVVSSGKRWYKVKEFDDVGLANEFMTACTVYEMLGML